jgi:tetratricopeptide (TPR) repeat protein
VNPRVRARLIAAAGCLAAACATPPAKPLVVSPALSAAQVEARLAEADAMAARGCYLCLREASAAYFNLIAVSDSPEVARHALENELMTAMREDELRLPDSGAKARAQELTVRLLSDPAYDATNYDLYSSIIARPADVPMTLALMRQRDEERKALVDKLEAAWPTSPIAAYVYIPTAAAIGRGEVFKLKAAAIRTAYPHNLGVRYRLQTDPFTYEDAEALAVIAEEPRFAEMRFLRGQRFVGGTDLVTGHHEYSLAYETLPDSLAIAVSFGGLEVAFGRFAQALELFDRVLAREPDHDAQLGRAIALSSLGRHEDAIAYLDELLKDLSWRPGDKYYWRAWNHLRLDHARAAYEDANAGLKSMVNTNIYQVAGIASYKLTLVDEARADFENSVQMNPQNCDSIRYVGILDAAERKWPAAVARFSSAAGCYTIAIAQIEHELAEKQKDTSGLYAGQIAALTAELTEAKSLLDASLHNAEVATKNAK